MNPNFAGILRLSVRLSAILGLAILASCGHKAASSNQSGQWLAKVDGREITVHQVNAELNNAGAAAADLPADMAQRRMVEAIVERQLLVDAAAKAKLDRSPEVMQAIEQARQQIIAQAYLRSTVGTHLAPSQDDIKGYYNEHPDLFASRKQLEMRQLSVDKAGFNDDLAGAVDASKSLDDVEAAFKARNVAYVKGHTLRTSSDLPPQMQENMKVLLSGKPFVINTATNVIVGTMSVTGEAPVSLHEASPQIAQYLINTRGHAATATEVARLRKDAQVEYKTGYGPALATATESTARTDAVSSVDRAAAGLR